MLDQDLILILVVLFFVLGCSFKCNGIKENFVCNDKQCADILEMEGEAIKKLHVNIKRIINQFVILVIFVQKILQMIILQLVMIIEV